MATRASSIQARINKITGVSSNVNGARGVFRVNGGKSAAGTSTRLGNRQSKAYDIKRAFGISVG